MERTFVALAGVRKGSGGRVDNLDVDLGLCVHVVGIWRTCPSPAHLPPHSEANGAATFSALEQESVSCTCFYSITSPSSLRTLLRQ